MAQRALQPCAESGCYALTRNKGGRCDAHKSARSWRRDPKQTTKARGYGGAWRKLRTAILERDRYTCQECGRPGDEVDHVIPKAKGGADTFENLQTLCRSCHKAKTARENR